MNPESLREVNFLLQEQNEFHYLRDAIEQAITAITASIPGSPEEPENEPISDIYEISLHIGTKEPILHIVVPWQISDRHVTYLRAKFSNAVWNFLIALREEIDICITSSDMSAYNKIGESIPDSLKP